MVNSAYTGGYKWCEIGYQDPTNSPAETASYSADIHTLGEIISVTPNLTNRPEEVRSGRRLEKVDVFHGKLEPSFDVEYKMASGRELFYVMGTQGTVSGTDPYTHEMVLSNTLPYFSGSVYSTEAQADHFYGCIVESWKMSATEGSLVSCNLTAMALNWDDAAAKPAVGSESSPDYADAKAQSLYHFEHSSFEIGTTTYHDFMHGFDLDVSHTAERAPAQGKAYGAYSTIGARDTKLSVNVDVENGKYTFQNLWKNKTVFTVTFSLTKTAGTYTHYIQFTFPECKITTFPKNFDVTIRTTLDIEVLSAWTCNIVDDVDDYLTLT